METMQTSPRTGFVGTAVWHLCMSMLLGAVTIATLIPSSVVVSSQSTTGSPVPLFTAIDLNPKGFSFSLADGISGGQQVGYGYGPAAGTAGHPHALLWRGSAASVVDLHPRGFSESAANGVSDGQQVGNGTLAGGNRTHALLWRGSASNVVDLYAFLPPGFLFSNATGIDSNGHIVGYAHGPEPTTSHAFLWKLNTPTPAPSREQNTMRC